MFRQVRIERRIVKPISRTPVSHFFMNVPSSYGSGVKAEFVIIKIVFINDQGLTSFKQVFFAKESIKDLILLLKVIKL